MKLGILVLISILTMGVLIGCAPKDTPVSSASQAAPTPAVTPAQPATPDVQIPEKRFLEISEAQVMSLQTKVSALLENTAAVYPCQPVRSQMQWLLKQLKSGKVGLAVAPQATGQVVAMTKWDRMANMPIIVLAGPVLQEKFISSDDVSKDSVIAAICHESLHIRHSSTEEWQVDFHTPRGREIYVAGEAKVWSHQIEEIVRPMMKSGRWVDGMSAVAEREYARCGNLNSPEWKKWVARNLCVTDLK